jgi:ABC-type multidrug transport system fused ATPase/permease subunit
MMANTPYQDNIPVGNMANIIFKEVDGAVAATMAPTGLIVSVIVLSGYLSILFLLSWKMTIVSVVIIIFTGAIPKIWIKESLKIGRKLVYANTKTSEFFIDRLKSPRLVRLSGTEDAEINEFFNLTLVQRNYQIISAILRSKTVFVMEPIIIMLSLIFLYFSYTMMKLSLEEIGLYLVVALRLVPATKSIVGQFQAIQNLVGSVEILNKHIVSMTDATERDLGTKVLLGLDQEISYNNLSYYYTKDSNFALNNINIKFKANKTTAIVGPSGSGKSTLIDLLPRLRLPTRGSIQIDGVGINKITLASLRKAISYAPQSPQIFNGTIKEHILYGKVDATDDEVEEAAYLSGAKEFINDLPLGFDALLGEDACKLSGGQKQRLDLARALVGESPILILDEPTSSLDAESEEIFRRSLLRIRNNTNTTIIVIAHKLSSISSVDKIVVLNQGMVESSGTHLELLNKSDWYTKAWNFQQL